MRKKGSPEALERVRLIAANMIDQGKTSKEIAQLLEANAQTVRQWKRAYVAGGREALLARKPPGGPRKLGERQRAELVQMLAHGPGHHGYDAYLWTTKLIARLVREKLGVEHHHDHVGVLLRALGFSPQKPARRAKERDEDRIRAWAAELWPALLKKVASVVPPSSLRTRWGS